MSDVSDVSKASGIIVRAIQMRDLDSLLALAAQAGDGMTTLKADRVTLERRVAIATASFSEQISALQRDYMFVMEDVSNGRIVGVCAIKSAVGMDDIFYNYRLGTIVHSSQELHVFSRMETLYLSNDLTGSAELCSLYLHPDYRHGNYGKLLSKSRFLFIAQFPHLFPEKLIAEMRGFLRSDGSSPFWDGLGRHFFKMDFNRADDLSALGKKSFIAELMPGYPIYVKFLSQEARDAIGQVHLDTAPARHLLEQEGFHYEGYVDIFDAGPVLQVRVKQLRALRESMLLPVADGVAAIHGALAAPMLVANTALHDFRVIVVVNAIANALAATTSTEIATTMPLSASDRQLLGCSVGDVVRAMPLNVRSVG